MDDDLVGCGCLVVLIVLLAPFAAIGWFAYDGYYTRKLPEEAASSVEATARIVSGSSIWSFPHQHLSADNAKHALVVSVDNRSDFVIQKFSAYAQLYSADNKSLLDGGPCLHLHGSEFRLVPGASERDWCAVALSSNASSLLKDPDFERFEWSMRTPAGHRLPRRLVKAPVDWISSLFERVDESH